MIVINRGVDVNSGDSGKTIQDRVDAVWERIARAAETSGRSADEITLIAVGKTHPPARLIPAIEAGIRHFGENRIQEAENKIPELSGHDLTWHMVGHLQRNKARTAINLFHTLHSLDSKRLARRLQRQLDKEGVENYPTLIQVNASGEKSKYGIEPDDLEPLLDVITEECTHLEVRGLMTIAPWTDDETVLRKTFRTLRRLSEDIDDKQYKNVTMNSLSMGMTNDYQIAIQEGATHLRIGRAIFGERQQ